MKNVTTTDLSDFGSRERALLIDLLTAWHSHGLPEDFSLEDVVPVMNQNSGCVFLTNSEFQVAMMNGDKLESWYNCPNCGHEGFAEDCHLRGDGCCECLPEFSADFLKEEDREKFSELFYEKLEFTLDEGETSTPWGCPWYCSFDLKGSTIEEMVDNYIEKHIEEIRRLVEEDEERECEYALECDEGV